MSHQFPRRPRARAAAFKIVGELMVAAGFGLLALAALHIIRNGGGL